MAKYKFNRAYDFFEILDAETNVSLMKMTSPRTPPRQVENFIFYENNNLINILELRENSIDHYETDINITKWEYFPSYEIYKDTIYIYSSPQLYKITRNSCTVETFNVVSPGMDFCILGVLCIQEGDNIIIGNKKHKNLGFYTGMHVVYEDYVYVAFEKGEKSNIVKFNFNGEIEMLREVKITAPFKMEIKEGWISIETCERKLIFKLNYIAEI